MKRFIAAILLLSLLYVLAGCAAGNTEPTSPPADPTETKPTVTDPTQPDPPVLQEPMFSVSVPVITEYGYSDDNAVIFSHTYQVMTLTLPDPEVADRVIVDFLNRADEVGASAGAIYAAAQADYDGSEDWVPYACSVIYNPVRIDAGVLSLYGISSSYSGTSHPMHLNLSANYDLITGKFLTLDSILAEGVSQETVYDLLIGALNAVKDQHRLYSHFEQVVRDTFNRDFIGYENWYFSDTGLCFYFSPYEIAPYSSGTVVAEIPYSMLLGVIDDQFFPPELVSDGEVFGLLYEQADMDGFDQICEVTTDDGGQRVILHSGNTAVGNVRLTLGTWTEDGMTFVPTATILACTTLTPGDAIVVQTSIPDVLPNLQLSYTSGGAAQTHYIFQSGEDGSIILTNE